jgi:hypothetical protein
MEARSLGLKNKGLRTHIEFLITGNIMKITLQPSQARSKFEIFSHTFNRQSQLQLDLGVLFQEFFPGPDPIVEIHHEIIQGLEFKTHGVFGFYEGIDGNQLRAPF